MQPNDLINEYIEKFNSEIYMNKKEVMYRIKSPLTIDEFWPILLQSRKNSAIDLPLIDQQKNLFWFTLTDYIKEMLDYIDASTKDNIFEKAPEKIQKSVILNALIDEAFNSSVIEGAFSTKKRTKEMVEKKATPKNKSEQMIINNYLALDFILENLGKQIDEHIILSIYKIVVQNTLDKEDEVEKYRTGVVMVWDPNSNNAIYTAPKFEEVQDLMNELINFINKEDDIHPIIKSCIIHFYFVYIHPFFDGNGRTARAISYMYLLKNGYNFFKFFSISSVVREEKNKYYKALKDTEDYESDLTYFIYFYLKMIQNSVIRVYQDFEKEYSRRIYLVYAQERQIILSKRQRNLINFLVRINEAFIEIGAYKSKYKVSYETARSDLNELVSYGLLKKEKKGRKYLYTLIDLNELI